MNTENPRTVSVPHLVFALVFLGIAAVHAIGDATDADLPHTAIGFPAVLIAAGVVGLVAAVVNNRRRSKAYSTQLEESRSAQLQTETSEDTTVIEEQS